MACTSQHANPPRYEPRRPEQTALHEVIRQNYKTVLQQAREHSDDGSGYPAYVEKEFESLIACGDPSRGFYRLKCPDCHFERLLAFS